MYNLHSSVAELKSVFQESSSDDETSSIEEAVEDEINTSQESMRDNDISEQNVQRVEDLVSSVQVNTEGLTNESKLDSCVNEPDTIKSRSNDVSPERKSKPQDYIAESFKLVMTCIYSSFCFRNCS